MKREKKVATRRRKMPPNNWFNRDRAVNKVDKQLQASKTKTRSAARPEIKKLNEKFEETKKLSQHDRKLLESELAIAQLRRAFLEAIFKSEADLRSLIEQVQEKRSGSQTSSKGV